MPVTDEHPEYTKRLPDWQMMNDAIEGERAVKEQGTLYLPKTSGMIEAEALAAQGDSAVSPAQMRELYASYLDLAEYPLWVKDSLRTMMGMVSRLEPQVELPGLEDLETDATSDGFSAKQLFMRVCADLLVKGRKPLLCDFDDAGAPYVATYAAEDAINWQVSDLRGRGDLVLAVFRETRKKPGTDEFNHEAVTVYRVLDIFEGRYRVRLMDENGDLIEDEDFPGLVGAGQGHGIGFIPVVFAGSTDNNPAVDEIPLITMAKAALKYYRLSADYFQSLHYTAHPQPVVTGLPDGGELHVTGAMAAWTLPADGNAFYLEFTGAGIDKTREAMRDQRNAALEAGARVIDTQAQESGYARRARQDDQHATLHSVVMQAAEAVEQCFRYIAEWKGLPTENIIFTVEPKFTTEEVDAAMMQIIGNLVLAGEVPRPVLYSALRKSGLTELSDEDLESQREFGLPATGEQEGVDEFA